MPISYVGGESANTTTVTLPAGAQAGDLAVVLTGRTSTAGSSIPVGWTDLGVIAGGSGGSSHGQRVGWKILEAADITAGNVGTWANAVDTLVLVYRGAESVGANSGTGANSTTITFPARTGLAAGSWQVALGSHRTATNVKTGAITDYTNRGSGFAGSGTGGWDSNASTSGFVQRTLTVNASSGNVGRTLAIIAATGPEAKSGSDTVAFQVTEASVTELQLTGVDTLGAGGTEIQVSSSDLVSADSLALDEDEGATTLASSTSADTLAFDENEASLVTDLGDPTEPDGLDNLAFAVTETQQSMISVFGRENRGIRVV